MQIFSAPSGDPYYRATSLRHTGLGLGASYSLSLTT